MLDFWRNWTKPATEKRLERLNAYLDERLTAAQRESLEQELGQDAALRETLAQLQQVKAALYQLPRRAVPRNFTLDPSRYGRPAREPLVQAYPILRLGTVLTAFFFILTLFWQLFTVGSPMVSQEAVSMAPALPAAAELAAAVTQGAAEGEGPEESMAEAVADASVLPLTAEATMSVAAATEATPPATELPAAAVLQEPQPTPSLSSSVAGVAIPPTVAPPTPTASADTAVAMAPMAPTVTAVPTVALSELPRPTAVPPLVTNRAITATEPVASGETAVLPAPAPALARDVTSAGNWLLLGLGGLLGLLLVLTWLARRRTL